MDGEGKNLRKVDGKGKKGRKRGMNQGKSYGGRQKRFVDKRQMKISDGQWREAAMGQEKGG